MDLTRIAIAGLDWWGPSPRDFARVAERFEVDPIGLANLQSPIDRRVLKVPGARQVLLGGRALRGARKAELLVILTPHRVPHAVLQTLRRRAAVVAWLGDEPKGPRAIRYAWSDFDAVFAADHRWVAGSIGLPWPHLVPTEACLPVEPPRMRAGAVVGTPYPDRVAAARELVSDGWDLIALGPGWPSDIPSRATMDRLATLQAIRRDRRIVINIPHRQMSRTLNPFFFDVAAAGIVQVYLGTPSGNTITDPNPITTLTQLYQMSQPDMVEHAQHIQDLVTQICSVDARLQTIVSEVV